jgi:protein-tyrosine phosphatase
MAEAYMRSRLADGGLDHVVVGSAGTLGIEGAPASAEAIAVLHDHGVDLGGHRSRGIRPSDLRTADLVLAMALDHLEAIDRMRVRPGGTVRLLREFESGPIPFPGARDLPDPIGQPLGFYREVFDIIRRTVDHALIHLRSGAQP